MPAQSQQQQKLFGLALSVKRGETPRSEASSEVLDIVDSMTEKQIEDFASTSHSGLPSKVEAKLRELVRKVMRETIINEDHTPEADIYTVKPCNHPNEPWAVWEGDVRVMGFQSKEEAQSFADEQNKKEGLAKNIDFTNESVNEAASRTAMEIGGLTGLNKDAIQKFVDTHNMDIEKVYQYVKKGKLTDRLNFVTAIVGTPGNPVQKRMIKMFGESVNEANIRKGLKLRTYLNGRSDIVDYELVKPNYYNAVKGGKTNLFKVINSTHSKIKVGSTEDFSTDDVKAQLKAGVMTVLKEYVSENFDKYSKDAITDMIINLSRYEGNDDLIADLKKILKKRNLGKLKKESVNEGIGTIALGVAGGLLLLKVLKFVLKKVVGAVGMNVALPKEKLLEVVNNMVKNVLAQSSGKQINMFEIVALQSYLKDEINAGRITTVKQIIQVIDTLSKKGKNESINEAKAIGKKIFSNARGKLFFGYQNDDNTVQLVDYKTWKKLPMKDLSNEFLANRVINSIVRNERQFNKKVDYNMWSKKTNPSFEERMDYFIKNNWISNITKTGIKESVNEYNVNKKFGSKYDIGAGSMGNGTTFWNRAEEEFGDYKKIAHVSDNGMVKFYDKSLPSNVKKHIEDYAKTQKESVNEHKDCGCGCKGTTVGGCNTSLTEGQLNEWRAEEVLQQLGGRKFIAMTGAKNFVKNDKDKSITFKIPRAKDGITHVMITLNASDTYTVNFLSIRGNNIKQKPIKGVYNDQLQSVFTQYTGLYTSL